MPDRRFQHTPDYRCMPAVRYDRKKIATPSERRLAMGIKVGKVLLEMEKEH
jgi:methyl coenzyme M reductase subunit D